jgi:hypothetical protein
VARRRMTIKRLDPWSVLKFGAFANVVLYAVFLLVAGVVWFIIDRLQLVDQACEIALDVGFTSCGVNAGNLFQVLALLGGMWVIVQTAILVFLAFLYNLIADLTGGLVIGVIDDGASDSAASARNAVPITASSPPSGRALAASSGRTADADHSARKRPASEQRVENDGLPVREQARAEGDERPVREEARAAPGGAGRPGREEVRPAGAGDPCRDEARAAGDGDTGSSTPQHSSPASASGDERLFR